VQEVARIPNHKTLDHAIFYGATWGTILACVYIVVAVGIWLLILPESTQYITHAGEVILLFAFYCIPAGIVGAACGALTGSLLWFLVRRLVPKITRKAWLIGAATCAVLWLASHFTFGQALLYAARQSRDEVPNIALHLYWLLVGFPGAVHVLSGAWFAQRYFRSEISNTNMDI
jgi:hypothetical protein